MGGELMKTALDVFNKVSEHLLTQNERSLDTFGDCLYRSAEGLACAVGCLIKDEFYSEDLEHIYAVNSYTDDWQKPIRNALELSGVPINDEMKDLVQKLQVIHDSKQPEFWRKELAKVEIDFFWEEKYENNIRCI